MYGVLTLTENIVADYCSFCKRHQERTIPEAFFYFLTSLQFTVD